uniref:Uncharacterized protein n=1 Tax=Romanomermis culicivorax TaxID=13658 RepID=A0A915J882_ROMCU
MDTLYNNEFSHTADGEEELHHSALQRCQPPAANHFSFSDYPPDDYYDHRTIIMTTRNLHKICPVHLIVKKIALSKQLLTTCTR